MLKKIFSIVLSALLVFNCSLTLAYDESTLHSKSAILGDSRSDCIMFEHNADEKLPIASMTKIMTMLLTMEAVDSGKISLSDVVVVSETAAKKEGSHVYLSPGENITVDELLKAVAVASGNDAAMALAEHVGGSIDEFVALMNKRAKELGMNNTNFVNCNGLDDPNHYSSARDVYIMTKELLKHEKIINYTTIWMDTLRGGTFGLSNTNKLVRHYEGTTGVKTGSTSIAGFCVSASALRNNMHLISVVVGADSSQHRFADASNLLNYGFNSYKSIEKGKKNQVHKYVEISKSKNKLYPVVYSKDVSFICPKTINEKEIKIEEKLENNLSAPMKKDTKIGEITYIYNGNILGKTDVVMKETAEKIDVLYVFKQLMQEII